MIDLAVSKLKVHSALFIVAVIYGANYSIAKIALPRYIEPFGFILLRLLVASLLFWGFSALTTRQPIEKKDIWLFIKCAFFGAAANMIFFFQGLSLTNPINASVIMTLTPIIVLLTAYFYKTERLTIQKAVGVLIGATGAYLLLTKDGISLSNETFVGDLFIILNASCYAIYLVIVKPLMVKYKPLTVIKWVFLFGALMTAPFGTAELVAVQWETISFAGWISITYVIVAATFTVYLLNVWSLQYVNSSVVGIYIYLQPVVSTIIAVTFRNDPLSAETIIYALVIMIGVYVVSKK